MFSNGQTIFVGKIRVPTSVVASKTCASAPVCRPLLIKVGIPAAAASLRRVQLRRDAAGAKLASALTDHFSRASFDVGYQGNPFGIVIQSRISVIDSLEHR